MDQFLKKFFQHLVIGIRIRTGNLGPSTCTQKVGRLTGRASRLGASWVLSGTDTGRRLCSVSPVRLLPVTWVKR